MQYQFRTVKNINEDELVSLLNKLDSKIIEGDKKSGIIETPDNRRDYVYEFTHSGLFESVKIARRPVDRQ